jgi:GNAT superfamily N-acetyltransferase
MTIIEYVAGHEEAIRELVGLFHDESLKEFGFDLDDNIIKGTISLCEDHSLLMFEGVELVGMIGGFLSRSLIGKKIIFNEVVWYVKKDHRRWGVRLYRAMEAKLYAEGVQQMMMVSMANSKHDQIDKLYKKLGYAPCQTQYIKELGD